MSDSRLSALQSRVLELLAPIEPRWTLTGGGALVGFHLGHRTTRDLDLFWHGRSKLAELRDIAVERLRLAGLAPVTVRSTEAFHRLTVESGGELLVIDLVAEPIRCAEQPEQRRIGSTTIQVDTRHEILVNKLGALLHRCEIRDLLDLEALVRAGGDLQRALVDAAGKDRGFSPLMLTWLLRDFPIDRLGVEAGLDAATIGQLTAFRAALIERLAKATHPGS